jgi:hypothetical protein
VATAAKPVALARNAQYLAHTKKTSLVGWLKFFRYESPPWSVRTMVTARWYGNQKN